MGSRRGTNEYTLAAAFLKPRRVFAILQYNNQILQFNLLRGSCNVNVTSSLQLVARMCNLVWSWFEAEAEIVYKWQRGRSHIKSWVWISVQKYTKSDHSYTLKVYEWSHIF